jgi:hypothetical protein
MAERKPLLMAERKPLAARKPLRNSLETVAKCHRQHSAII